MLVNSIEHENSLQHDESPSASAHALVLPSLKNISKKTIPLMIAGFIRVGEEFANAYFIAQLGSEAISANALINITLGLLINAGSFLNATTALVATAQGEGNLEKVGEYIKKGWLLATILSLPTSVAVWHSQKFLSLFGQSNDEVVEMVGLYARPASFAIFPLFWLMLDTDFLKSSGHEKDIIPWNLFSSGLGIVTTYLFCAYQRPSPKAGVTGAAYALLIQTWISWLAMRFYQYFHKKFAHYKLYTRSGHGEVNLKRLLCLGTPFFFVALGQEAANFVTGIMIGKLGTKQLAINQIISQYHKFLQPVTGSLRLASQVLVSKFKGLNDYRQLRTHGNVGMALEAAINGLPMLVFGCFPRQFASVFISDNDVEPFEDIIRVLFITKSLAKLLEAIQNSAMENLKGLLDIRFPCFVNLLSCLAIMLPTSYLLAFVAGLDLIGINLAADISLGCSAFWLLMRWNMKSQLAEPCLASSRVSSFSRWCCLFRPQSRLLHTGDYQSVSVNEPVNVAECDNSVSSELAVLPN